MRRVVQRSLLSAAAVAALVVGVTTVALMRDPPRAAARGDEGGAPRSDEWTPPPLVPAEAAAPTVELTPKTTPAPAASGAAPRQPVAEPEPLHVRGRLVGLVPTIHWKAPVFVLPRVEAEDDAFSRRSTVAISTPKFRCGDAEAFMDSRLGRMTPDLLKPWDSVTESRPTLERLNLVDFMGRRVPAPSSPVAEDGTFDVALDRAALASGFPRDAAARLGRARVTGLDFVANDPGYMPVVRSVDLSQRRPQECADFEWTVEVVPAGRVTGLVDARERGARAAQAGLGAVAALFEGTLDEASGTLVDVGRADDRYVLRAPKSGTYTIVLAARDLAPLQLPVEVVVGAEREQPTATFDRGASIEGVVRWPPPDRVALAFLRTGAAVTAIAQTGGGKSLDLPGHPLLYANGKLERRSATVTTDFPVRGRAAFRIDGLEVGHAYRVLLGDPSLAGAAGSPVSAPPVVAPARDVELFFDLAWLNVTVLCGDRPLPDARVSVSSLRPDPEGARRSSFFLPPFHEGELLVEAEGYEPAREHFTMGPAGTTTSALVLLVRKAVHARLELSVDCDAFETVHYACVSFEPVDAAAGPAFTRGAFLVGKWLHFAELPEGTFRLRFDALSGEIRGKEPAAVDELPPHRLRHQLLDPDVVVELADGETATRSVVLHEGAALRLTCHDVLGNPLAAECRLADAAGKAVAFVFVKSEAPLYWDARRGAALFESGARTYGGQTLDGSTPCRTDPALKPGRYVLTVLREGFDRAELAFDLAPGELRDCDVVLTRQP